MYTYICVYEWETMAFKHLWKRFKVFPFEKNQIPGIPGSTVKPTNHRVARGAVTSRDES